MSLIEQNTDIQYLQSCVDALRNTNQKLTNQLKDAIILQPEHDHLEHASPVAILQSSVTVLDLILKEKDGELIGSAKTEHRQLLAVCNQLRSLLPPKQKSVHKLNDDKSVFDDFVSQVFVQPLADLS